MIAGIELGGTKTVVAIGSAEGRVLKEFRFPTTLPGNTLGIAIDWLRERGQPENIGDRGVRSYRYCDKRSVPG